MDSYLKKLWDEKWQESLENSSKNLKDILTMLDENQEVELVEVEETAQEAE